MSFNPNNFVPAPIMSQSKTSTSTSPTSKVSSAELLSMLKKPTVPSSTTAVLSTAPTMVITDSQSQSHPNQTQNVDSLKQNQPIPLIKDDYTLQGLVNLIKSCPADRNIFSIGIDLENVGLALNQTEPLRDTLMSPWFDGNFDDISHGKGSLMGLERGSDTFAGSGRASPHSSASLLSGRRPSTLDSILPSCYSVSSISVPSTKINSFFDETLFYIFYSMPGDRMQELAARELYMRNWRFFKPSKSWISCVDSSSTSSTSNNNNNNNNSIPIAPTANASFFVFDQSSWIKVKRTLSIQIGDLDDARPTINPSTPNSPNSNNTIMHGSGTLQSTSVTH